MEARTVSMSAKKNSFFEAELTEGFLVRDHAYLLDIFSKRKVPRTSSDFEKQSVSEQISMRRSLGVY